MIVLLGYMGSGKTAVGQCIARLLGKTFIDLDEYIEKTESRNVATIFDENGAIYFRKKEREALETVLREKQTAILSLGGGTPCYYNNMELITKNPLVQSYYLQASVSELTNRLYPEIHKRPLLHGINSHEELAEFVGKHLFERATFYSQAGYIMKTDGKSPETVAQEIIATLF